jgi:hypothetical protein
MILEFPRGRVRHASEVDAAPEAPRLSPGAAVLIVLLLSLALWAALIWGAIALLGAING